MTPQPFVPLADGAQVEISGRLFGEFVENRLWFVSRQPPVTTTQIDDLAVGVYNWHSTQVMPYLSVDLSLDYVRATDWTAFPPPYVRDAGTSVLGGDSSPSQSANVSIRVLFKGSNTQTFKSNSNFVPGIPISSINGNTYDNTIKNHLFNAYVNLIDLAASFGPFPAWRWVITSRVLDKAYRSTQEFSRTDFIRFPSPYVSPRRRRLPV